MRKDNEKGKEPEVSPGSVDQTINGNSVVVWTNQMLVKDLRGVLAGIPEGLYIRIYSGDLGDSEISKVVQRKSDLILVPENWREEFDRYE